MRNSAISSLLWETTSKLYTETHREDTENTEKKKKKKKRELERNHLWSFLSFSVLSISVP